MIETFFIYDKILFEFLHSFAWRYKALDFFIFFFSEPFAYVLFIILFGLLVHSSYSRFEKLTVLGFALFAGVISRFVLGTIIQSVFARPRPFLELGTAPLFFESSFSFPSGHASFFFAFASAVWCYKKRWGMWFFLFALIMGISRVMAGVHYPIDILGGALLGGGIGYVLVRFLEPILKKYHH